jgi:C1A family cysteine protease
MKKLVMLLVVAFISLPLANGQSREFVALQDILKATNASWEAEENSLSRMSPIDQEQLLGLLPGIANPEAMPQPTIATTFVRTERHETPHTKIKDQKQCGSCYSFGASATYEGFQLLKNSKEYDLSEQWFMMKAKAIGPYGGCQGWYLDTSMNLLKNNGVANESDCPYLAVESNCTSGSPVHTIKEWASTTDLNTIKEALKKNGPVYVGFAVYSDFFNYKTGYYEYKSGSLRGYHAVCIVGFDDTGFKVKNSWGTGWGESGYFRIKYNQMNNSVQFGTCFGGSFYIVK